MITFRVQLPQWIAVALRSILHLVTALCPLVGIAQRNMVEVPSSEIVERNKFFIQGQATLNKNGLNTGIVSTYGLAHDIELGLILYKFEFQNHTGLDTDPTHPNENPDVLISVQKGFSLADWLAIGLGTECGTNISRSKSNHRFVNFSYFNSQYLFGKKGHMFVLGAYYGNDAYVADGSNGGIMAGVDFKLIDDKLSLLADFFSGTSEISVINAAFQVSLPKEWKITVGAQLPNPGSNNEYGGLIQISKN